jgi:hypothetical protein
MSAAASKKEKGAGIFRAAAVEKTEERKTVWQMVLQSLVI